MMISACLVALCCLTGQGEPGVSGEGESARTRARLEEGLRWLMSGDPVLREFGAARLREVGRAAIPALEAEVARTEAREFYEILRELLLSESEEKKPWRGEEEFREVARAVSGEAPDLPRGVADQYVYAKLKRAVEVVEKGDAQAGLEMVHALLLLEPRSRYVETLHRFRRYCDHRIVQATLLQAQVLCDTPVALVGDKVTIRLRLQNVSPREVRLRFGTGVEGSTTGGVVPLPLEVQFFDPRGPRTSLQANLETTIEPDVPIATGAQWEREVELDTGALYPESDFFRTITVSAWAQPAWIEGPQGRTVKRIQFEPVVIRVLPRKYAGLAEQPLRELGRLIGEGNWNEILCAAMLLDGSLRRQGIEILLRALEAAKNREARYGMANLLYQVTDQKLGDDPKAWREWFRKEGVAQEEKNPAPAARPREKQGKE